MIQFRKSRNSGPFRFTLTKRGISSSVGGGPLRIGLGSDRRVRRTLRAPGTGFFDTKVVGGGRRRRRRGGMSFLSWVGLAVFAMFVWVACTGSGSKPDEPGTPWAAAPQDGVWVGEISDQTVPFGETSPARIKGEEGVPGFATDYTFTISSPPELTTYDDGKTVWVSSAVGVTRVDNRDSFNANDPVSKAMKVYFQPGETSDSFSRDETHGTNTNVECDTDQLAVNESTTCTVSFKATEPSEITNFHWSIDGWEMGAWPGQARDASAVGSP